MVRRIADWSLTLILVLAIGYASYLLIWSPTSLVVLYKESQHNQQLVSKLAETRDSIIKQRNTLNKLKNDSEYLEEFARKHYHFIGEGEVLIIDSSFSDQNRDQNSSGSSQSNSDRP